MFLNQPDNMDSERRFAKVPETDQLKDAFNSFDDDRSGYRMVGTWLPPSISLDSVDPGLGLDPRRRHIFLDLRGHRRHGCIHCGKARSSRLLQELTTHKKKQPRRAMRSKGL